MQLEVVALAGAPESEMRGALGLDELERRIRGMFPGQNLAFKWALDGEGKFKAEIEFEGGTNRMHVAYFFYSRGEWTMESKPMGKPSGKTGGEE